jgi:hypothetical protein
MKKRTTANAVGQAFQETGSGWVLRFDDRDAILAQAAREIDEFIAAYRERFGETPDPFALLEANPAKAAAFFQTFTGAAISIEMRLMIWMVIHGAEFVELHFAYRGPGVAEIRVVILPPGGRQTEPEVFKSADLWDFQVLRHIGLLAVDGVPILDGYYAAASRE